MAGLSVTAGLNTYRRETRSNKQWVFVAIFVGVVFHWVYEVIVAGLKTGGNYDFGTSAGILGHIFISFVASVPAYLSAYQQLSATGSGVRYASAFVTGLGVDALVAPWAAATPAVPA